MRRNKQVSPSEDLALLIVSPLVMLYELEHVVHIETFLQFDFVLTLYFAYDPNQIQEGIFFVDVGWLDLVGEVLV